MHFNCSNSCENTQREQLQLLFDHCFFNGNKIELRENYRILRQLEFKSNMDFNNEIIDISDITEVVATACDILFAETGVGIIYCGNKTSPALCNQKYFIKALLNLISNAYLYGCEKLITIKTIEMSDFIRVEVQNGGAFISNNNGNGLDFVRKVCKNANGNFFIEQSPVCTRAVMIFRKTRNYNTLKAMDFYSLINDRLSPVYIELFGMEYH